MLFFVVLMNILEALTFPCSKIALSYASPLFLTGFRMTIAGVLILMYQYLFRRASFSISLNYWKPLFFAALVNVYITSILSYWGFQYVSSTEGCFLYNLYPFAAALVAYIYVQERLTKSKWIGLIIGFLGTLLTLFATGAAPHGEALLSSRVALPELAILVSLITDPLGWIFIQKVIYKNECDAVMANGITMLGGGIFALLHSRISEGWSPLPITNYQGFLVSATAMMLISNLLGNSIYISLLKRYSLTFLAFSTFSEPLLVGFFEWFFFNVTIPKSFYFSFIVVSFGLYIFYKDELSNLKKHS